MAKRKTTKTPVRPSAGLQEDTLRWTNRLDTSITRLADATSDLSVGVAAHTQRLDNMEQQTREQKSELTKLAHAHETDYRALNERISTVQHVLTEKLNSQTDTVTAKIDTVASTIVGELKAADKSLGVRVGKLENWKTWLTGGFFVLTVIFAVVLIKLLAQVVPWLAFLK